MLTLRPAYDSSDRFKLIERIKSANPPAPRSLDIRIPRDLETIILKAIDKDPDGRYASAAAMAEDLRRFLVDEPIRARQASSIERYARWARRNPVVAGLGGALTVFLVIATVVAILAAGWFAQLADRERRAADAERLAKQEASRRAAAEGVARAEAEKAHAAALAETYNAVLSEVKALRAGHAPGWRDAALSELARLAAMRTPRRDPVELRAEAVACLGEFDVQEVAHLDSSRGVVWSLDFSHDSRLLATATPDGSVDFWDIPGLRHAGHLGGVTSMHPTERPKGNEGTIRFLPDGTLACVTWRHRVDFFGVKGPSKSHAPLERSNAQPVRLEVDAGGRWLVVGWDDGLIEVHDPESGVVRRSFPGDPSQMAISPDGRLLATRGPRGAIVLHPTDGQGASVTLGRNRGPSYLLAFSSDGSALAAAAEDHSLSIWDLATQKEKLTLLGHKAVIRAVAFSPDGALVATASNDHTTRLWDARDGRPLTVLPAIDYTLRLAFSPDGDTLAVVTRTGTLPVSLYQLMGRKEHRRLVGHVHGAQRVAFHPRAARLASGADDHAIIVWDVPRGVPRNRWAAHDVWVTGLAYAPDGSRLASTPGPERIEDFAVRVWDGETGKLSQRLPGPETGCFSIGFDPHGRYLAAGDDRGTLFVWDTTTQELLWRRPLGAVAIKTAAFLENGRQVLAAQLSGATTIIDVESGLPVRRGAAPSDAACFLVDSPGGRLLAGDSKGGLTVLSLASLKVVGHVDSLHEQAISAMALSPDGKLLATGGNDRRIALRDANTLRPIVMLPTWTGAIKDLAFDSSGRWLAVAGVDSDVGLWDLLTIQQELARMGLAWHDQPMVAPGPARREGVRPKPRVIRPDATANPQAEATRHP